MYLYLQALRQLLRFEYYLLRRDFAVLHEKVRGCPCSSTPFSQELVERICTSMDAICVWYPKRTLCLQRSAATTCLLRKHGVPARMVLGVQNLPFKAHAWVEVHGRVVNDKPYTAELYIVLDSC